MIYESRKQIEIALAKIGSCIPRWIDIQNSYPDKSPITDPYIGDFDDFDGTVSLCEHLHKCREL